jgi:hypothetical protein
MPQQQRDCLLGFQWGCFDKNILSSSKLIMAADESTCSQKRLEKARKIFTQAPCPHLPPGAEQLDPRPDDEKHLLRRRFLPYPQPPFRRPDGFRGTHPQTGERPGPVIESPGERQSSSFPAGRHGRSFPKKVLFLVTRFPRVRVADNQNYLLRQTLKIKRSCWNRSAIKGQ